MVSLTPLSGCAADWFKALAAKLFDDKAPLLTHILAKRRPASASAAPPLTSDARLHKKETKRDPPLDPLKIPTSKLLLLPPHSG